jgi:hypothetical protein
MKKLIYIAALLLLSACATDRSCYIGWAILPPGPFVHCGVDLSPETRESPKLKPHHEFKPESKALDKEDDE